MTLEVLTEFMQQYRDEVIIKLVLLVRKTQIEEQGRV
jgi:hypothetical protein